MDKETLKKFIPEIIKKAFLSSRLTVALAATYALVVLPGLIPETAAYCITGIAVAYIGSETALKCLKTK